MSNTLVREQIPYDLNFVNVTGDLKTIPAADVFTNKNVIISQGYRMLKLDRLDNKPISHETLKSFSKDHFFIIFEIPF